jgi:hypothetical protein
MGENSPHPKSLSLMERDFQDHTLDFLPFALREKGLGDEGVWSHFPAAGGRALIERVLDEGEIIVGELRITVQTVQPVTVNANPTRLESPSALRVHLRENPFRPLASARGLTGDWVTPVVAVDAIPAMVETVYPGVVAALAADLSTTLLSDTIARQQGDFRALAALTEADVDHLVETVCENCVKCPVWHKNERGNTITIPCREACNFWMSAALNKIELREKVAS